MPERRLVVGAAPFWLGLQEQGWKSLPLLSRVGGRLRDVVDDGASTKEPNFYFSRAAM